MNKNIIRGFLIVAAVAAVIFNLYMRQKSTNDNKPHARKDLTLEEPKPTRTQPIKITWKTYMDKQEHFQMRYPEHWKLKEYDASSKLLRADFSDGDSAGVQVRVENGVSQDLQAFSKIYLAQFKKEMVKHWKGEIGIMDSKFEQMGTHDGFRVALVLKRGDGQKWFLKQYLWRKDDKAYIFQAGSLFNQIQIYEPLFDKIAGSFTYEIKRP
ncbi:MAG: hypothetical protein GY765_29090 [bacterium]|nr:hypothetical protein [bacterium]